MSLGRASGESGETRVSLRHPPREAVSVALEVPFHDVDALKIVWHAHYLRYLDVARTALMRARGLDIPQLAVMRYHMVVVENHCRYIFPLRYGEHFRVTVWVVEVANWIKLAYLIRNLTRDRRAARAHSTLVTIDQHGNSLWETPAEIRDRLLG